MVHKFLSLKLMAALLTLMPLTASADPVQLASWTFETGYDVSDLTYTPNSEAAADVTGWFNGGQPVILANEAVGDKSNYTLTGMSSGRYWQLAAGYQVRVFRIENTVENAITDYSDASQHNVYFEASFPTKGYKDITIDYSIAPGNNTASAVEAVVSTDGGTTWFDAGSQETSAAWWQYKKNSVTLSANNKDQVKVRLIMPNGAATNWNLDYLTVNGEAQEALQPVGVTDATLTWEFDQGKDNPTSAVITAEAQGGVSTSSFTYGSNLFIASAIRSETNEDGSKATMTEFEPVTAIGKGKVQAIADNLVTFSFITKKGVTFSPKSFSFNACKVATSGGTLYVYATNGRDTLSLAEASDPARKAFTPYNFDLTGLSAADGKFEFLVYITNLNTEKQVAIGDVVVKGDFNGTPEAVPVYTMSVKSADAKAGSVSCNPAGAEFDEGTELTVAATENFGSHFIAWVNDAGETVSTKNPYTFTISENTSLTATYTTVAVYALNMNINGDANSYMISYVPEGNVVDGVHNYEVGTEVKLVAANNRILTFTGWEDGNTSSERVITIDGDKSVTATYSAADYIVGWDFVNLDPKQDRKGDFIANSENAGNFSLVKPDGTVRGWLSHANYDGKSCAINWSGLNDGYNFQAAFKSLEYSNIRVAATLECHYNAHQNVIWQYSTDGGTSWTDFATTTLVSASWQEQEFALPEAADNQAQVLVRWYEDLTSTVIGNSGNNGLSITDVFVLGDLKMVDDGKAPALVSSNPAQGATGVSASGSIILNFDEKIKAGAGVAKLGDEELSMTVSGKAAVFAYNGLKYATEYTFEVPAGLILDRTDNAYEGVRLTFTTMERTQPTARLYDAVVAQDGSGDYLTVQAAIDAAPAGRALPWLIFVKKGVYEGHHDIPANKPYIHIIGQGREDVEISDSRLSGGENAYPVQTGATMVVNAQNCFFEGVSLVNSWGRDKNNGPQALALYSVQDRFILNRCGLISYQDTWLTAYTPNYRQYAKDCWIEGAVDFIYGQGNVVFDQDTINIVRKSGGYIVAPNHAANTTWGYVFLNNVITAPGVPSETDVWLGRPWHANPKTVFINTKAEVTIPAAGWYDHMGGLPVLWADYNTVDGKGNPVDLSQRRKTYWAVENGDTIYQDAKNYLTDEEAAQYTVKNVLSGDDGWNPELMCEPCDAPVVTISGSKMQWQAVPYAICYVVLCDGEVVGFTTETSYDYETGHTWQVAAANEWGGLSLKATAGSTDAIETLEAPGAAMADAPAYDLMGRKMNFTKGLFIQNGKIKFVK